MEDRLGAAVLDVEACKSESELITIYKAYEADFGKDSRFLAACKAKKESFKAA